MYTHRGAYLNALGESIETGLSADSVYLWTLPMFHCNGWCFPWAVTAVAAPTSACARSTPAGSGSSFDHEGVTHYCGAPTVQHRHRQPPRRPPARPAVTVIVAGAPPSPTLLAPAAASSTSAPSTSTA